MNPSHLILLIVGLFVGVLCTLLTLIIVGAGKRYPVAVMTVLDVNLDRLRNDLLAERCDAARSMARLTRLQATSREIEPAFASLEAQSASFRELRLGFIRELDAAGANPAADCVTLNTQATAISQSCEACHVEYR